MKKPSTKLIPLPAAKATRNALIIDPRATDKEHADLGHTLAGAHNGAPWWLGDYGLDTQRRKRKELAALETEPAHASPEAKQLWQAEQQERIEGKGAHYMGERAAVLGLDEGYWRNTVMVSRYYEVSHRCDISYSHHVTAMLAAGGAKSDPKKAIAWLLKAQEKGWSVSQLRHEVNLSLATGTPPQLPPPENLFAPLDDADHWAIAQQDTPLNPEYAKACLTRFAALIAYIDRLRAAAAEERAQA